MTKHLRTGCCWLIFCVFLSICFIFASPTLANDTINLKVATYTSDASAHHHVVKWWAKELEKRTDGNVKVKIYPGGSLVKAKEMLNAGKTGLADVVQVVPAYDPSKLVLAGAPYKPFNTPPRADQFSLAFNKLAQNKDVKNEFNSLGVEYIFLNPSGNYNIMGKKPVRNLSDLKGLKIRSVGDYSVLLKALGAVPVYTVAPDIYNALERGVVDVVAGCGDHWMYAYKVAEASKNGYYTNNINMGYAYTIQVMNKSKYDSLPSNVKNILGQLQAEIPKKAQEMQFSEEVIEKYIKMFKDLEIEFITFPTEDRKAMIKVQDELLEAWIAEWEAKGVRAKEVMKDWKKIMAEVVKKYPDGL